MKKNLTCDAAYAKSIVGVESVTKISHKCDLSVATVGRLIRQGLASPRTIDRFLRAYKKAEYEKLVLESETEEEKDETQGSVATENIEDLLVKILQQLENMTASNKSTYVNAFKINNTLLGIAKQQEEQGRAVSNLVAEANSCKEYLKQINDRLSTIENAQREFGEYEKRYSACTYKTLKEFKEKLD